VYRCALATCLGLVRTGESCRLSHGWVCQSGLKQSSCQSKRGQVLCAASSVVQFGQWSVFKVKLVGSFGFCPHPVVGAWGERAFRAAGVVGRVAGRVLPPIYID